MADPGCPEYPAYVPYLSWGTKIHDYRMSRDAEVSQSAFAQAIAIDVKRLQDLESDVSEPSYEEHQKFADLWCDGDIEQWWVRDQGFPPSSPSQDKRALRDLRRDNKRDKGKLNRYRALLIEVLSISLAENPRNMGQWLRKVYRSMEELNDRDQWPESLMNIEPDVLLQRMLTTKDALTRRQIAKLLNSWELAWDKSTPGMKKMFKGFNGKITKMGQINDKNQ